MPDESIREQVLQSLRNTLFGIQSGVLIDACVEAPTFTETIIHECETENWEDGEAALPVSLNESRFVSGTGSLDLGKEGGESKEGTYRYPSGYFSPVLDITGKSVYVWFYVKDKSKFQDSPAIQIILYSPNPGYYSLVINRHDLTDLDNDGIPWNRVGGVVGDDWTASNDPDPANFRYIWWRFYSPDTDDTIDYIDFGMDKWYMLEITGGGWLPVEAADYPVVSTDNPVIGLYSIAYGKLISGEEFGIEKILDTPVDGTDGIFEFWHYVYDKEKLLNSPPSDYSLGVVIGSGGSIANSYSKAFFHDDIKDVVNDNTNGWNRFQIDIVNDYDLKIGSPDISAINYLFITGKAVDVASVIPVGELKTSRWRFINISGDYNLDVNEVYRFSAGAYETPASPCISMAALREDFVSKTYPIIESTMIIGLDAEIELVGALPLDKELGKFASDIQVALASNQKLDGLANYVEIKSLEYSRKEGTSTGILTVMIEVQYNVNQKDPTKAGL